MVESLIRNYSKSEDNSLVNYVNGLDLNGLVTFYLKCSNHLYFQRYDSIDSILELIYQKIVDKIGDLSLLDTMEVYLKIFNESLAIEDSIEASQNIISVRKYNLKDNFFIKYESERKKMSEQQFIENYHKGLDYYENDLLILKNVFSYLDKLQNYLLELLDNKIETLSEEERIAYLIKINNIIEENSIEIIKRNEIKKNRRAVDIQSRMNEISTFEIFSMLDTTNLKNKNYVYMNFQEALKRKYNKNKN